MSYVSGNTWVSGPSSETLPLELTDSDGIPRFSARIHNAVITMTLSDDRKTATSGVIAGILDTEEASTDFATRIAMFDSSLCPPSVTGESLVTQLRQSSDILVDGTQDPTKSCTGISIGLGFSASVVQLGTVTPYVAPADPCVGVP
ncbi:MAG: hypothetical protein U0165_12450 [Polyangiaceae bacterium]